MVLRPCSEEFPWGKKDTPVYRLRLRSHLLKSVLDPKPRRGGGLGTPLTFFIHSQHCGPTTQQGLHHRSKTVPGSNVEWPWKKGKRSKKSVGYHAALPHPARVSRVLNKYREFQRAPGRRVALSSPTCLPQPGAPFPGHSHLQRTVGSIDKAKVLGFCQDHEGTFLMALRERNRDGVEAGRLQSRSWVVGGQRAMQAGQS